MPILLKKIEVNVISLFGELNDNDFTAPTKLYSNISGDIGFEDYINFGSYKALTQDFSNVGKSEISTIIPIIFGLNKCETFEELNISY